MKDFDYLRKQMLFHKIVEWEGNRIVLDNGMELRSSAIVDIVESIFEKFNIVIIERCLHLVEFV